MGVNTNEYAEFDYNNVELQMASLLVNHSHIIKDKVSSQEHVEK